VVPAKADPPLSIDAEASGSGRLSQTLSGQNSYNRVG
jgi:hypothetical protein